MNAEPLEVIDTDIDTDTDANANTNTDTNTTYADVRRSNTD